MRRGPWWTSPVIPASCVGVIGGYLFGRRDDSLWMALVPTWQFLAWVLCCCLAYAALRAWLESRRE